MTTHSPARLALACLVACLLPVATSQAQTGVSDDRVSLPEGPGSLEGVGENVNINPNMGSTAYSVPIRVPQGFGAVTPMLSLNYRSGNGSGLVGMGWMLDTPMIERMTYRGLPEYDADDDFTSDTGSQLIRLPDTNPPVYRARYEKGFARYTWMQAGADGYWIVEYPDGSTSYYGAAHLKPVHTNTRARPGALSSHPTSKTAQTTDNWLVARRVMLGCHTSCVRNSLEVNAHASKSTCQL